MNMCIIEDSYRLRYRFKLTICDLKNKLRISYLIHIRLLSK